MVSHSKLTVLVVHSHKAWLHGEFQPSFWNKSSYNQIVDYMEIFSARNAIQPGLKILAWFDKPG